MTIILGAVFIIACLVAFGTYVLQGLLMLIQALIPVFIWIACLLYVAGYYACWGIWWCFQPEAALAARRRFRETKA